MTQKIEVVVREPTTSNGHLSPLAIGFYPTNGLNPYTGYGRVELGLARALQNLGVRLDVWPDEGPVLLTGNAEWLTAPHIEGCKKYLYTMSESDRVSDRWVELINQHAAAVFVPVADLVTVYEQSGVTVPVHAVGLGVDLFHTDLLMADTVPAHSPFTFVTYSLGDYRKGAELAIMAFVQLYDGNPDFRLIIKARDGWNNTWLDGLEHPQIEIVGDVQSNQEWVKLLAQADCFVFPSKAEGYGMPPREATLAGVPTIATEWLGMSDVAQWGIPLRVDRMQRCTYDSYGANADGALWAMPDMDQLRELMQWVVGNYADARDIANSGRDYLLTHCRWSDVGARILEVIHGSNT